MKKEKIKHIVLILMAVCLIGIGYLNYDYEPTIEVATTENATNEASLGDVQLVNGNAVKEGIVPNDDQQTTSTNSQTSTDEYFSATRIERDTMYSQMLETYQKMVDSNEISNDQKAIAIQEINNITNCKNAIMIAENLIKNKNFEDVVILVSNNNASVIVKSSSLNPDQIAQIQNIVCRELNLQSQNITISQKQETCKKFASIFTFQKINNIVIKFLKTLFDID